MRIVVTGASGFLGAFVVRALSARDETDVVGVSRRAIEGLIRVTDYGDSPSGDVLVHLAEENDRGRARQAGQAAEDLARSTVASLLAKGYGRVVYASSGVLYGDAESRPRVPGDPIRTEDTYTRLKRQSELAVLATGRGLVVRLANLYGPGM